MATTRTIIEETTLSAMDLLRFIVECRMNTDMDHVTIRANGQDCSGVQLVKYESGTFELQLMPHAPRPKYLPTVISSALQP